MEILTPRHWIENNTIRENGKYQWHSPCRSFNPTSKVVAHAKLQESPSASVVDQRFEEFFICLLT
jgi:hypothetical protein